MALIDSWPSPERIARPAVANDRFAERVAALAIAPVPSLRRLDRRTYRRKDES